MQVALGITLLCALFASISSLCAVTPTQMVGNLDWFMSEDIKPRLHNQIKGMFATLKKRESGDLDLRSKRKKKVRVRLARLRGQCEVGSADYKATVGAWYLANHYSLICKKTCKAAGECDSVVNDQEEDKCFICLEQPHSVINTLCGHTFCPQCLLEWFAQKPAGKSGVHTLCPCCRADFGINLKFFLQHHGAYEGLAQENHRSAQEVDYRELAHEQAVFDEEYIGELFDENELAQLIQLQQELDAQRYQEVPDLVDDCDDGQEHNHEGD